MVKNVNQRLRSNLILNKIVSLMIQWYIYVFEYPVCLRYTLLTAAPIPPTLNKGKLCFPPTKLFQKKSSIILVDKNASHCTLQCLQIHIHPTRKKNIFLMILFPWFTVVMKSMPKNTGKKYSTTSKHFRVAFHLWQTQAFLYR